MDSLQGTENNVFTITMPALFCSFPLKVHPEAPYLLEVGEASLLEWCRRILAACERFQLPNGHLFSLEHTLKSTYSLAVATFFSNAVSTQRLVPVLKLMNWFFLADTSVDEPSMFGADPAKAMHVVDKVSAIFREPIPASADHQLAQPLLPSHGSAHEALAHIFASYAAEWWAGMCVDMPLSLQARFSESFLAYLRCILEEVPFRSAHVLPEVEEYLRIRVESIGWYPLCVLTEYTLCIEMGEEAVKSPLLVALKQTVCESIVLVNDVTSFRKEYERGDYFNVVMVLCYRKLQARGPSSTPLELATPEMLQESMNEACEMIKETDHKCVRLLEKIKKNQKLMQEPGMEAFLDAMGRYVPGNMYWHLVSDRYCPQAISLYSNGLKLSPHHTVEALAKATVSRPLLLPRPKTQVESVTM